MENNWSEIERKFRRMFLSVGKECRAVNNHTNEIIEGTITYQNDTWNEITTDEGETKVLYFDSWKFTAI